MNKIYNMCGKAAGGLQTVIGVILVKELVIREEMALRT